MLICVHKDDYFRMQERVNELMQYILNINELISLEKMKELKIKKLKDELSDLENDNRTKMIVMNTIDSNFFILLTHIIQF